MSERQALAEKPASQPESMTEAGRRVLLGTWRVGAGVRGRDGHFPQADSFRETLLATEGVSCLFSNV